MMRTIRTAKNRESVLAALAEGWSVHASAVRAGIGTTSLHEWRRDAARPAAGSGRTCRPSIKPTPTNGSAFRLSRVGGTTVAASCCRGTRN